MPTHALAEAATSGKYLPVPHGASRMIELAASAAAGPPPTRAGNLTHIFMLVVRTCQCVVRGDDSGSSVRQPRGTIRGTRPISRHPGTYRWYLQRAGCNACRPPSQSGPSLTTRSMLGLYTC